MSRGPLPCFDGYAWAVFHEIAYGEHGLASSSRASTVQTRNRLPVWIGKAARRLLSVGSQAEVRFLLRLALGS